MFYIALFVKELWHVSFHALDLTEQQIMRPAILARIAPASPRRA
jgi:hypothetical protein